MGKNLLDSKPFLHSNNFYSISESLIAIAQSVRHNLTSDLSEIALLSESEIALLSESELEGLDDDLPLENDCSEDHEELSTDCMITGIVVALIAVMLVVGVGFFV